MMYCLLHDKNGGGFITKYSNDREYFKTMNDKGYGIYIAVNEFEATEEEMKELGVKTKRNKPFLKKLKAVYADLDIAKKGDGMSREDKEKMKDIIVKALYDKLPPSSIIKTSNGVQPVWKIDEDGIDKDTQTKYVDTINGIIEWSKTVGAAGDKVKDVTRIIRCPGYNHMKEEPFMCTIEKNPNDPRYSLDEVYEVFKGYVKQEESHSCEYVKNVSTDPVSIEIDRLEIKDVSIRAFSASGHTASFDNKHRLILDGRLTGTFQGKEGDKNYLASTSHEPYVGNVITVVADILGINNKEARKWIMDEYNITYSKAVVKNAKPKEVVKPKKKVKYTWGTQRLDDRLAVIKRHKHIVLVGETGGGKTSFAFDLAIKNAKNGLKVLFISLEMPADEIIENKAQDYAGITLIEDRDGEWSSEKENKIQERLKFFKELSGLELVGADSSEETEVSVIIDMIRERQPDLAVIDNLDLISDASAKTAFDRQESISKKLTMFSKNELIPTMLLHHYKKATGKVDRGLDSVRGSAKIVHNAYAALKCSRNMESDLSPMASAAFGITSLKERRFGSLTHVDIFWQNGTFSDDYNGASSKYVDMYKEVI